GARVDHSLIGGFRFRMPPLWGLAKGTPKFFMAISSGQVTIGANAGDPWQVRYELKFTGLVLFVIPLSLGLIVPGPRWARGRILDTQLGLWTIAYAIPYLLADSYFRRWLKNTCAAAPVTRTPTRGSA